MEAKTYEEELKELESGEEKTKAGFDNNLQILEE